MNYYAVTGRFCKKVTFLWSFSWLSPSTVTWHSHDTTGSSWIIHDIPTPSAWARKIVMPLCGESTDTRQARRLPLLHFSPVKPHFGTSGGARPVPGQWIPGDASIVNVCPAPTYLPTICAKQKQDGENQILWTFISSETSKCFSWRRNRAF